MPSRAWYRNADPPLVVFCRFADCYRTCYLVASAIPVSCPGCSRKSKDGGDWWTTERPEGKPVNGVLYENDKRFLRSLRIQPWEGGIDT